MPYPVAEIIEKTLAGISRAQRDYNAWSGGCDLWEASEYMITTSIARQISTLRSQSIYLTLEYSVRESMSAAGVMKGRPPKRLAPRHAKFDILLWHNSTPIGVVEVKRNPQGFANIRGDVERICEVLKRENEIQFGLIAYYTSRPDIESKLADYRVSYRIKDISEKAGSYIRGNGLRFAPHSSRITTLRYDDDYVDIAWAAVVLEISR